MQNEPDKERKGKFSVQYNIKVEVSTETGDRKCTIDTTETHNQSRNRGNYSGRRNFRGGRRGRSGYRGQYFYRGQNRRYVNKDSSEQGNSSTEHSVKDAPIAKVPIIDAEEENWDNDDAYANNLNEENNSKEEDSTKQGEYGDYEAEAEYYEEDYPDENADHGIENNNSLDDRCENTLSSNDGDYKDLDVHERSGAEVEETNTASNNSQERTIGIGNEIKQQTNEIEYSKQNTTSNEQLEIDSKSLEQLTLNDQTKLGPKSDDVCGKVNPNDETVHEGYENELSKEDTTSDEQLEKDYGGSQQLISEGKPDIELKSNDISNNKVSSKEEIVVSTAKKNTAEEENKHNE